MNFRNLDLSTCIEEARAVALLEELKSLLPPDLQERLYDDKNKEKRNRDFERALFGYLHQFVIAHNSVSSYAYTSLITHAVNLYSKQIASNLENLLDRL